MTCNIGVTALSFRDKRWATSSGPGFDRPRLEMNDAPKNKSKEKGGSTIFGELAQLFNLGLSFYFDGYLNFDDLSAKVPESYFHPELIPDAYLSTYNPNNSDFNLLNNPRLFLDLIIEPNFLPVSSKTRIKINLLGILNVINMSRNIYNKTIWGKYGEGNYAFIAQLQFNQLVSLEANMETPPINVLLSDRALDSDCLSLELQGFFSCEWGYYTLQYKSGFHKYDKPFYEVVDNFKAGAGNVLMPRLGVTFNYCQNRQCADVPVNYFLACYGQMILLFGYRPTTAGEEFTINRTSIFSLGVDLGIEGLIWQGKK